GPADGLEHLGRSRLLPQRFAQLLGALLHLVEQPHVLDGDHRLIGERGGEFDLLSGEWTHGFALHDDDPNWDTFSQKADTEQATKSAEFLALKVVIFRIS